MVSPNETADCTPCAGRHPRSTEELIAEALQIGRKSTGNAPGTADWINDVTEHLLKRTDHCGASREDARKVRVYYDDEGERIDRMEAALRAFVKWAEDEDNDLDDDYELSALLHDSDAALKDVPAGEEVLLCYSGVRALEAAITMTFEEPHDDRCD